MNPILSYVLVVWIGSELCLTLSRSIKRGQASKDRYSLLLIWIVNLSAIALGVWAAHRLTQFELLQRNISFVIGLCILAFGLTLRWYSVYYLGRYFTTTVSIAADHHLIETGPYRFVRHPSYAGALLAVLGFALSTANLATVLIMTVPAFVVQLWRMHVEEHSLLEAFGEQYRSYMRRTKRLFPGVY